MLSDQSIDGNGINFDSASFVIALPPSSSHFHNILQINIAREMARRRYAISEVLAISSSLELVDEPMVIESTATSFCDLSSRLRYTDDSLIDEPLPRMPVSVQAIKLKFIMKGKAKTKVIDDTELID